MELGARKLGTRNRSNAVVTSQHNLRTSGHQDLPAKDEQQIVPIHVMREHHVLIDAVLQGWSEHLNAAETILLRVDPIKSLTTCPLNVPKGDTRATRTILGLKEKSILDI